MCQLPELPAVIYIGAGGRVTLYTLPYLALPYLALPYLALPYLALPYYMAPEYAYSFAPVIMDYLATKFQVFQYLAMPRLTYGSKTNEIPSSSHVLPAPKNCSISHY